MAENDRQILQIDKEIAFYEQELAKVQGSIAALKKLRRSLSTTSEDEGGRNTRVHPANAMALQIINDIREPLSIDDLLQIVRESHPDITKGVLNSFLHRKAASGEIQRVKGRPGHYSHVPKEPPDDDIPF